MTEEWRWVVGYEGFYEVSSLGRVRSVDRWFVRSNGWRQFRLGRMLSPGLSGALRSQYLAATLRHGVKGKVHVLVCTAFHGPRPQGMVAAHYNGDRLDNRASNLRWATPEENIDDSRRHGTFRLPAAIGVGEENGHARLTWEMVDALRSDWADRGLSHAALGRQYGISSSQVGNIVNGRQWVRTEDVA